MNSQGKTNQQEAPQHAEIYFLWAFGKQATVNLK